MWINVGMFCAAVDFGAGLSLGAGVSGERVEIAGFHAKIDGFPDHGSCDEGIGGERPSAI